MITDADIKAFAAEHAPELVKNITRLCGQVIAKGLQGHLEQACELQRQVMQLELERDALKLRLITSERGEQEAARAEKVYREAELLLVEPERLALADRRRMDWLATQFVTVRTPLRYGSRENFMGSPDDNDGESVPWDIRKAIDAAMRKA